MKLAWRIREKLLTSSLILLVAVMVLAYGSFQGAGLFRGLTKSIRDRASELPMAATLSQRVSDLRITFLRFSTLSQLKGQSSSATGRVVPPSIGVFDDLISLRQRFLFDLEQVNLALSAYRTQLEETGKDGRVLSDTSREKMTVREMEKVLASIATGFSQANWIFNDSNRHAIDRELNELQEKTTLLPGFLSQRMEAYHEQARAEYKTWMYVSGMMTLAAIILLGLLAGGIYLWILRPLRMLIRGSRKVADGDLTHRIQVDTNDEVADLAAAMNLMTENFCSIRNDLDEQVRDRTREAIRCERLASVGFLAAGVAHEINNPLASIALSAESVERRFDSAFETEADGEEVDEDVAFIRKYLQRIQQESFRCKGITERLLDFSRIGETERKEADLTQIIQGVIDMVKNLARYREKHIWFQQTAPCPVLVTGQEFKQVIMNLLTNALDCVGKQGNVWLELKRELGSIVIEVRDDGCGMTPEILEHIFEPFFTKREHGEGTGLGLSISHQIIADHGGTIRASSKGLDQGAVFQISLPLKTNASTQRNNKRLIDNTVDDQEKENKKRAVA